MNATAIRSGMACWLCFALFATALYGQNTSDDESKPKEAQPSAGEEYVRKLKAELEVREAESRKLQADLTRAEGQREILSAQLEKMRAAFEAAAQQKSAEKRAKLQAEEVARTRTLMSRQLANQGENAATLGPSAQENESAGPNGPPLQERLESARKGLEEAARATAAEAMKRAAETLTQAAQQAERAASKLDQTQLGPSREPAHEMDEDWQKLLGRAAEMLKQTRRNEHALAKLKSAIAQLRKTGRREEADELQAEAQRLLGGSLAVETPGNEAGAEVAPRDRRPDEQSPARGDLERAVDDLRREVEQLRREVRDLRQSLQRGAGGKESSRRQGKRGRPVHEERAEQELANVGPRFAGEILGPGEAIDRVIRRTVDELDPLGAVVRDLCRGDRSPGQGGSEGHRFQPRHGSPNRGDIGLCLVDRLAHRSGIAHGC